MRKRKFMKKQRFAVAAILAVLLMGICAVPVQAVPWLWTPRVIPHDLEKEPMAQWKEQNGGQYTDWCGVYYAKGVGLDVKVTADETGEMSFSMKNYNSGGGAYIIYTNLSGQEQGQLVSNDGEIVITRLDEKSFQIDFSENMMNYFKNEIGFRIYLEQSSVVFTDIETLMAEAVEDNWSAVYYDEALAADTMGSEAYYSLKQLYGTSDYMLSTDYMEYNEQTSMYQNFFTEMDGFLIHENLVGEAGPGITTYSCYSRDSDGNLHTADYPLAADELAEVPNSSIVYRCIHEGEPAWEYGDEWEIVDEDNTVQFGIGKVIE